MTTARHVVLGVGNELRGDDGAGLAVAERLRARVPAGVAVVPREQEPTRLIDAWEGAAGAIVIDAVRSGAAPGTVHRFDASTDALPARFFRSSTHAFGVGEAIELARALGKLPPSVLVYGVEGERFDAGAGLTPQVESGVAKAADAVLVDLEQLAGEA
jgi:hydrogenase maturation protease